MAAELGRPTGSRILNASAERHTHLFARSLLWRRQASYLGGIIKIGLGLPESIPGVRGQLILE
jgi:hypothetical protein